MAASSIAWLTGTLSFVYLLRAQVFFRYPISSFLILGVGGSLNWGALLVQAFSGRSLDFNLEMPVETFAVSSFTTLLAILTHCLYRASASTQRIGKLIQKHLLKRCSLLETPRAAQLWVMGFVGIAAILLFGRSDQANDVDYGNVVVKIGQAIIPFYVAPFLIPLSSFLFRGEKIRSAGWIGIALYFVLSLAAAVIRNSRAIFANLIFIVVFGVVLAMFSGSLKFRRKHLGILLLFLLLGAPVYYVISNLTTAMLIAREKRADASAVEMIDATLEAFSRPDIIADRRKEDSIITSDYNEVYIDNVFFSRLIETKNLDLNLANSRNLSIRDVDLVRSVYVGKLINLLPTPVANLFDIGVAKRELQYSGGDLYRLLAGLGDTGSYDIGNSIADGLVIWGPLVWPILFFFYSLFFIIYDASTFRDTSGRLFISPMIVMQLPTFVSDGLSSDNFSEYIGEMVRTYPQLVLLYSVLYMVSYSVLNVKLRSKL